MRTEMHRMLLDLDVAGLRRLWAHVAPGMPQPRSDAETIVLAHHARTQMQTVPPRKRFYSHRWLLDNGHPSGLPDRLKPSAERMYPKIADAVGISVNAKSDLYQPITTLVRGAMEDAVEDCYANGDRDPEIVKPRMYEAKKTAVRKLLGVR
jgi:hypothetical protein